MLSITSYYGAGNTRNECHIERTFRKSLTHGAEVIMQIFNNICN